jgi:hypothetical protein
MLALVLVAVCAQVGRNWLMLRAVGVPATVLDATAVLIAMVTLSQLPVGPSVGAAATVLILGTDGPAAAAAAGVLLTATGTAGALGYVTWAGFDRLWTLRRPARSGPPRSRRRPTSDRVGERVAGPLGASMRHARPAAAGVRPAGAHPGGGPGNRNA